MPRQERLDAPGTLHHVIGRGIERQTIFREAAATRCAFTQLAVLEYGYSAAAVARVLGSGCVYDSATGCAGRAIPVGRAHPEEVPRVNCRISVVPSSVGGRSRRPAGPIRTPRAGARITRRLARARNDATGGEQEIGGGRRLGGPQSAPTPQRRESRRRTSRRSNGRWNGEISRSGSPGGRSRPSSRERTSVSRQANATPVGTRASSSRAPT